MPATTIVWFRNDHRLADNPALSAAARRDAPVVALFILDDRSDSPEGGAARWWLHHSLYALGESLRRHRCQLLLRRGDPLQVLAAVVEQADADALYFNRRYEPYEADLESRVDERFAERLEVKRFGGRLLFEPEAIATAGGEPYRVFTPFWKACLRADEPPRPLPLPRLAGAPALPGDNLDDWNLLPRNPDWSTGIGSRWTPGEAAAGNVLERFLDHAIAAYADKRDLPGIAGTSSLSPYLHFGEISPRQLWYAVRRHQLGSSGGDSWLRELGWRDFCHHLLFHWPRSVTEPFNPRFRDFPWRDDRLALEAWQRGRTGYPLVDAGMRELWHTGWMHNRVRMIAASFLVKHLLVGWWHGENWFRDTLVDADLANNVGGWQWVAGCGADAAPYFRIFNPVLQGRKFDADGRYVRRWVPELARLPDRHLHAPFEMPRSELAACGIVLGNQYPQPLVDHAAARQRALDALATTRE